MLHSKANTTDLKLDCSVQSSMLNSDLLKFAHSKCPALPKTNK